jgi:molybdopterin synthase sulfur carrier subunit
MSIQVHIPSLMRRLFNTPSIDEVEASTVREMIVALDQKFPGIGERLVEPDGELRRYVNVFISEGNSRVQAEATTALEANGEVWIVPNVAGGILYRSDQFDG